MAITAEGRPPSISGERPRLSYREDLATVLFGTWLIAGLFLDGWAHNNDKPESFFTPWHAVLYSGFLATAAWMWTRHQRHGGVPEGYGLGFIGVCSFAIGGVADMFWHLIFGVEVKLEALLSPSHLVLFVSGLLILSSPFRAAWSDTAADSRPTLGRFMPALLSLTLVTATVSFFLMEFSPFLNDAATRTPYRFLADAARPEIADWMVQKVELQGFASILIATVILIAPTLVLLRRWRTPPGSLTILFTTVTVLTAALHGFDMREAVLAGVAGGALADVLVQATAPASTTTRLRVVGFVVPVGMWLTYFALLATFATVGWTVEFWSGITVLSGLAGLGLAVLMTLPAQPAPGPPTY